MSVYNGTIDSNGQVVIHHHYRVKGLLLQDEGKDIDITIGKAKKRRSDAQNRWYWGVAIKTVIEELLRLQGEPYEKNDIHHYILNNVVKAKFKTKEVMGTLVTYTETKSTSAMSTKEFSKFVFELQVHFDRKGIIIPDPEKDNYTNDYEPKRKAT